MLAFGVFAGLLLILAFGQYLKDVIILLLLAVAGIFSTIYKRHIRVPPAVELITFSTVMAGMAYGPVVGAVFGAVVTLVAEIANTGMDSFIIGYVPARAAVGAVSAFFPEVPVIRLGVLMSLLYNAIAQPLYALQSDIELRIKLLSFLVVNVSFNFVIFSILGQAVKSIIM